MSRMSSRGFSSPPLDFTFLPDYLTRSFARSKDPLGNSSATEEGFDCDA